MIKEGSKVRLKDPHFSAVRQKQVPLGTEGRVKATRMPGPEALVKFKGFAWPMSMSASKLEEMV